MKPCNSLELTHRKVSSFQAANEDQKDCLKQLYYTPIPLFVQGARGFRVSTPVTTAELRPCASTMPSVHIGVR